jgi:hypothetical protein
MHNADLLAPTTSTTSSITPSEAALHQELLTQVHSDLDRARKLNAGRTEYMTRTQYRDHGEIELYRRLYDQLSAVGGHIRVAAYLGLPVSKGGAGKHDGSSKTSRAGAV